MMMSNLSTRLRFACKYALWHLFISAVVATLLALLVFKVWYPSYVQGVLGGLRLYATVVVVDVIVGPLLTLIISSPNKSRRERILDYTVIGVLQCLALTYGLYMTFIVRPIAVVFEVDRFVVVRSIDLLEEAQADSEVTFDLSPLTGPHLLGSRAAKEGNERLKSIELSLSGFEPSQRPSWWIDYDESVKKQVSNRAKSLRSLMDDADKEAQNKIEKTLAKLSQPLENLSYLPLTSALAKDWVVILDEDMTILTSVHVDGFAESR